MLCDCTHYSLFGFTSQVHRGWYHRDGGRDVRGLLRGRLHRPSPGSRFHGALWTQLSQWVLFLFLRHTLCKLHHTEDSHLPQVSCMKKSREQTDGHSYWSAENVTSQCSLPRSSMEDILDLWSLDITFTSQINEEHALELSFESLKQLLRTFTLFSAVCLLQNMGGNAKSIHLIYPCQNNLTSSKYQKWPTEF